MVRFHTAGRHMLTAATDETPRGEPDALPLVRNN